MTSFRPLILRHGASSDVSEIPQGADIAETGVTLGADITLPMSSCWLAPSYRPLSSVHSKLHSLSVFTDIDIHRRTLRLHLVTEMGEKRGLLFNIPPSPVSLCLPPPPSMSVANALQVFLHKNPLGRAGSCCKQRCHHDNRNSKRFAAAVTGAVTHAAVAGRLSR